MNAKPKILLVDDREQNLLALGALLAGHDAEVLPARSGREALELLLRHDVALAMIDVQMPEMDGFELAEAMRGAERTRDIPIVFVTAGLHDQARLFLGYDRGAVDFLVKPLEPHVVNGKVAVFLQLYRQRRQLAERIAELEAAQDALRRANRLLEEGARRKNEFLAVLSHELRNPLAPIRNSLYILERTAAGSEQATRAKQVLDRQVSQLARLVDDLLDVTRVTRNKIVLRREQVDLNGLARRTADDQRSVFERGGIRLDVQLAPEPLFVDGDPARLSQVVSNLLQNAAKFTRRGGTASLVVERDRERPGPWAALRVRDDGIGMDPATVERLFEPFMQADASLDRSKGGLGLGLALVKGLVELHGGEVSAGSEGLGRGSEFLVRLPVTTGGAASRASAVAPTARGTRRVLVIEDHVDAAESLRDALLLGHHEVEVATSGPDGLDRARRFRPDVVLCDIGLPGMDGFAVAAAFRADRELKDVHLVALTGYALPDDVRRAEDAGFERHLAKPPSVAAIEALLRDLPGRRAGGAPA